MAHRSLDRTRDELSEFLRRHRGKLTPSEVGLPETGRRRTPGLRREEVATLAGVGLTWYTWFEQGREIGVSEHFLLSVAKALKLDDAECCHLFLLAQGRPPPAEAHQSHAISSGVQRLIDELPDRPAYVTNLCWDIVAWNSAADRLLGLSACAADERNLIRMVFTDPELRSRLPDWQQDAPRLLAQLRCDLAVAPKEPSLEAFIDGLSRISPDFRRWWQAPVLTSYARGIGALLDADAVVRRFEHETLIVDEYLHLRLVVYFQR